MKERGNYETIGKAAHLYTKEIRSCLDLLIMSIMSIMLDRVSSRGPVGRPDVR
jgi:hypothetical protein